MVKGKDAHRGAALLKRKGRAGRAGGAAFCCCRPLPSSVACVVVRTCRACTASGRDKRKVAVRARAGPAAVCTPDENTGAVHQAGRAIRCKRWLGSTRRWIAISGAFAARTVLQLQGAHTVWAHTYVKCHRHVASACLWHCCRESAAARAAQLHNSAVNSIVAAHCCTPAP